MDIFFANAHPEREKPVRLDRTAVNPRPPKRSWGSVLAEQVVNSVIVGGIAGLSALIADPSVSWKAGLIAFGMTFLVELRKLRNI